jgi:O-antigen/teichoic acid export membrane protein
MYSIEARENVKIHSIYQVNFLHLILALLSPIMMAIFLVLYSYSSSEFDLSVKLIPVILFSAIFLFQDYARRVLFLTKRYWTALLIDTIAYLGFLLILIFINKDIFNEINIFIIPLITFSCSFIYFIITTNLYHISIGSDIKEKFEEYWDFSKWLSFSNILQWLSGNIFVLIGTFTLGPWVAGLIRIFQNLMGLFSIFFHTMENFIPIEASSIFSSNGLNAMIRFLSRIFYQGLLFLGLLILIIYFINPYYIIDMIYGNQYIEYGSLLYIYLIIYFFIFSNLLLRYFLRTIANTKVIFYSYIFSAIFSFIIAWPLVNIFEMLGIVLGTLFSQIIIFVYLLAKVVKYD